MADADPRTTFNVHDAKTNLSKLIDRAHAGEEIVLAKAGKPWAKLVPLEGSPEPGRAPGRWPALRAVPDAVWFDPLPDDERSAWDGDYSNIL